MTINGAITQLVMMTENSMMPNIFRPALNKVIETISELEPQPRQKGKWIANGDIHKECPFCGEDWDKYVFGEVWYTDELPKFCPNCGADMMEDT